MARHASLDLSMIACGLFRDCPDSRFRDGGLTKGGITGTPLTLSTSAWSTLE